ncbi:MAG: type II toxin-antitoxin system VapC family toxin [Geminicoccaceae bacterium]
MIVLDASVALKLLLPETDSAMALRLLHGPAVLAAPDILSFELAAAIAKYYRRRLITLDEARVAAAAAKRVVTDLHPSQPLLVPAFELSLLLGHAVYDCLYLVLARWLSVPLLTADRRMHGKAHRAGLAGQVYLLDEMDRLLGTIAT